VLQGYGVTIEQVADARKEALAGEDAWKLLAGAEQVLIAKGKAYQCLIPAPTAKSQSLPRRWGAPAI
jgi:hypothetical protein